MAKDDYFVIVYQILSAEKRGACRPGVPETRRAAVPDQ